MIELMSGRGLLRGLASYSSLPSGETEKRRFGDGAGAEGPESRLERATEEVMIAACVRISRLVYSSPTRHWESAARRDGSKE